MRLWLFFGSCFSYNLNRQPARLHTATTALRGAPPSVNVGNFPLVLVSLTNSSTFVDGPRS